MTKITLQEALCFKLHVHGEKMVVQEKVVRPMPSWPGILSVNQKPKINYVLQQHV